MVGSIVVTDLTFGDWRAHLADRQGFGIVIEALTLGCSRPGSAPVDYVNDVLLAPEHRDRFLALIDREGLVVCHRVGGDDALHRDVRGRSSRGRLSQGEYYHHDGCAGPIKPRVVEIRCPYQQVARHTVTSIAPFPEVVAAMLAELPANLRIGELAGDHADRDPDLVQGKINRAVRRGLSAEGQRAYLRGVDRRVGAYCEPWQMGESRFIANANGVRTMQHRRTYLEPPSGKPNGRLVKRWPAEAGDAIDDETSTSTFAL